MRSAWAGGLHLRSRTDERRGAGLEINTFKQSALIHDGYERLCHATPGPSARQTGYWMEAFLVSAGVAALAELGDKTQLLALVLAARFRAPVPVIAGIATAVLANHLISAKVGTLLAAWLSPATMRWVLVVSFFAAAVWMLIPDRAPQAAPRPARLGAYGTAVLSFFLLEFGDKTQLATVALAAKYQTVLPVVFGTTLGMLLVDAPAVLLGEATARRIPLRLVNRLAAAVFAALGVLVLFGARA